MQVEAALSATKTSRYYRRKLLYTNPVYKFLTHKRLLTIVILECKIQTLQGIQNPLSMHVKEELSISLNVHFLTLLQCVSVTQAMTMLSFFNPNSARSELYQRF